MNYSEIPLVNNEAIHNFELHIDGYRAFIDYRLRDGKAYLVHTEVPAELQGKGVAEVIVEKTLRYLEERDMRIVPLCQYVQVFLKRHPDWNRIVA